MSGFLSCRKHSESVLFHGMFMACEGRCMCVFARGECFLARAETALSKHFNIFCSFRCWFTLLHFFTTFARTKTVVYYIDYSFRFLKTV